MKPKNPKRQISQMDRFGGTNKADKSAKGFESNIGINQKVAPGVGSGARVTRKLSDGSYSTTESPDYKKTVRSGKNLLGRQVVKTKTASFGSLKKGEGTEKEKTIGDKAITKTKTVYKKGGGVAKSKSVTRVATSKKKAFELSKGAEGQGSGKPLGVTGTSMDLKRNILKSNKVTYRSKTK